MVPEHILTYDLYKELYKNYDDTSFLNDMIIVNYDKIKWNNLTI